MKLGVPQFQNLSRAHFAIKTGRAHIGLYTYLVQKLPVPGHGQFLDQISVKTYVGTPSFYCEMCPRKILKLGHAQFQKRDYPPDKR